MTNTATLAVDTADLAPVDEEALVQWSAAHLADCEKWLARRYFGPPPANLAEIRSRYAPRPPDHELARAVRELVERRAGAPSAPAADDLAQVVGRLSHDLPMYGISLRAGGFDRLRVAVANRTATPLYLPDTRELFLPRWLLPHVPDRLFAPNDLLPAPPEATVSWLFFQSLAVVTGRTPVPTLAQFYDIRESD
jgi:hypothetical protein